MGSLHHNDHARTTFQRPAFRLLPIPSHTDPTCQKPLPLRSLPDLVLYDAIHNPHHVFCFQSRQAPGPHGQLHSTPITYHQLAVAVENCCAWLLKTIPDAHSAELDAEHVVRKASPVALFLESDVGLFIYITALLTLNIPVRCYRLFGGH